jgi:hypothetical protein
MGGCAKGIEATNGGVSKNYDLGSCEAHVVSSGTQEDCGGATSEMGEG